MKLKIISLQRHPQKEIGILEEAYLNRLRAVTKIEVVNIRPKAEASDKEKTLREEEKLIQKELGEDENLVVLAPEGKEFSTPELAQFLGKKMRQGTKSLVFLIGGPQGVSSKIMERAQLRWSLSRLTFPHRLARLVVIEALYRSMDLLKGGPYHKE